MNSQISVLLGLLIDSDTLCDCPVSKFAQSVTQISELTSCGDEEGDLGDTLVKLSAALSVKIEQLCESCASTLRTRDTLRAELFRVENQLHVELEKEKEARSLQSVCSAAMELYYSNMQEFNTGGASITGCEAPLNDDVHDDECGAPVAIGPREVSLNNDGMPQRKVDLKWTSQEEELEQRRGSWENEPKEDYNLNAVDFLNQEDSTSIEILKRLEEDMLKYDVLGVDDTGNGIIQTLATASLNLPELSPAVLTAALHAIGILFRPITPSSNVEQFMMKCLPELVSEGNLVHSLLVLLETASDSIKCDALEYLSPLVGAPHLLTWAISSTLVQASRQLFIRFDGLKILMNIVSGSSSEAVLERALVLLWGLISKEEIIKSGEDEVSLRSNVSALGGLQVLDLLYTDSLAILENASMVIGFITRDDTAKQRIREEGGLEKIVAMLRHPSVSIKTKMVGAVWNCAATPENRADLRKLGAVPILLDLLEDMDAESSDEMNTFLAENAAGALWNVSVDAESKRQIVSYGGIDVLVKVIKTSHNAAVLENTLGTLWNCSALADCRPLIRRSRGLPVLLSILQQGLRTPNSKIVDNAAGALRNCAIEEKSKVAIKDAGGVPILVSLIRSASTDDGKKTSPTLDKVASTLWILTIAPEVKGMMQACGGCEGLLSVLQNSSPLLTSSEGLSQFNDMLLLRSENNSPERLRNRLKCLKSSQPPLSISMSIREKIVGVIRNCCTLPENRPSILALGAVRILVATIWDCFSTFTTFRSTGASSKRKTASTLYCPSPQLCETVASAVWHLSRVDKAIPLREGGLEVLCFLVVAEDQTAVVLEQAAGALSSLTAGRRENCEAVMNLGGLDGLLRLIETRCIKAFSEETQEDELRTWASAMFNILLSIRNSTTSSEKVMSYAVRYAKENDFSFARALIQIIFLSSEDCVREATFIIKNMCTSDPLRHFFGVEKVSVRLRALIQTCSSETLRRACASTLKSIENVRKYSG